MGKEYKRGINMKQASLSTKILILKYLSVHKTAYTAQVQRIIGYSHSTTKRYLKELVKQGLINDLEKKVGGRRLYSINKKGLALLKNRAIRTLIKLERGEKFE